MMQEIINYSRLYRLAAKNGEEYRCASPFPHMVLDDLVSPQWLELALGSFPAPEATEQWRQLHVRAHNQDVQYAKLGLRSEYHISAPLRQLIWELNSGPFLGFLEALTGIRGLLPDPGLQGGGLHQVLNGGVLGIHADFTHHRRYGFSRRLNVLLYLNREWAEAYGGNLELWSRDMQRCERNVRPLLGRCVIFNTDASSFHGHPRRLQCPEGVSRKSIALYYYSNGRKDASVTPTTQTEWQAIPEVALPESQ